MESYTRVLSFVTETFKMAFSNKTLLKPLLYNLVVSIPTCFALAFAIAHLPEGGVQFAGLAVGLTMLYFIDYFCNGLTVSLVHQQVTEGNATMDRAMSATKKVAGGILAFAAISAFFDLLASQANKKSLAGKILMQIIYAVWTTAVYAVMPAMVIEGLGFGASFKRSKDLMKNDPTNAGIGIIAISVVNYAIGAVFLGIAYKGAGAIIPHSPLFGFLFFLTFFNMYWSLSGYVKSTYYTCFYLWAKDCQTHQVADQNLAKGPLAAALR